jgi:hypothetical protein
LHDAPRRRADPLREPWGLLLCAFASLDLIQSVFTGFCPPVLILRKLGWVDGNDVIDWGGQSRS